MSSSQGSVSTATARDGSNLPPIKANKMKLDMPPRPPKAHARKPSGGENASGMNSGGAHQTTQQSQRQGGGTAKDDGSVPHVVRVTFLGVAGLLAKTPEEDRASSSTSDDGGDGSSSTQQPLNSPASADHSSLLFPLPRNMRVVASVSRSRTARGIPSGISKCLTTSGGSGSNSNSLEQSRPSQLLSPSSIDPHAGSFAVSPVAGEKILVEKQQSSSTSNKRNGSTSAPIEEVSIGTGDGADELFNSNDPNKNVISSAHGSSISKKGSFDPAPPSQLLQSRTSSTRRSMQQGSRAASGASVGSDSSKRVKSVLSLELETDESIEVVRPYSPSMGALDKMKKKLPGGGGTGKKESHNAIVDGISDLPPERFVAVWDENSKNHLKAAAAAGGAVAANKHQFVNLTNSLAFEAELRPSSSVGNSSTTDGGRPATPLASTTFAPKSFCVTIGLVPDFHDINDRGQSATPVLDEIGESMDSSSKAKQSSAPPPAFAIPMGFADLVINGGETLDGKRRQFDLPLSSMSQFIGSIGGEKVLEKGTYPFPLIELTADGLVAANKTDGESIKQETSGITKQSGKEKKKSIVKRMLMRKQKSPSALSPTGAAASPPEVYKGPPRSIFQLDRSPNAKERTLFLDRYGIDPSGDAVVRVGLEVFPRGSELEKTFRQKNKLRKKAQAAAAASAAMKARSNGRLSPSPSMGSRTVESDSRSLMDDEYDEAMLSSECSDSVYSQSFFTLDSNTSQTTWDESTMYTDALGSFQTIDDDSMSFTTGVYSEYEKTRAERRSHKESTSGQMATNFFSSLLNCNGPTACGNVDDDDMAMDPSERRTPTRGREKDPYSNIDQVASAVASMSMAEPDNTIIHPTQSSPHHKSASIASMETAARANNRPISPNNIKESGEELTLDTISPVAAAAAAKARGRKGPPPELDTSIPMDSRKSTAHTVSNESSPLAMIRTSVNNVLSEDLDDDDSRQTQLFYGEGHEFTLEEHQSASM